MTTASKQRRGTVGIVGALAALAVLTACSSTTEGSGAARDTVVIGSSASAQLPASSAASKTAASATPSPSLIAKISGTGTAAGSYQMSLWAHDVITDCGAHSYGKPIIDYFAAHPCRSATRRLWTFPLGGRAAALSVISVSAQIGKVNENPDFQYAVALATLENADKTGSVNDLLREGSRIPGVATAVPSGEVFSVIAQDGLVVIMDCWYTTGTTSPSDMTLKNAEADLSFSDAAAPDA